MRSAIYFCAIFVMVIGCQRDESIVSYRAPKEPPRTATPVATEADEQHAHAEVAWTLPAGWKDLPAGQMRYASFQAGDDPSLIVTVVALSPNQAVLPNINRWEGQIGLPPSSEADAVAKLKQIDVAGARISMLDLNGQQQSILVAWAERPDHTWYFKLQGPTGNVATQKANFDSFVQSIKFDAHEHAAQATPAPQTAHVEGGPKWNIPSGWQLQPEKPMRVATYRTSADGTAAEIVVSKFPANFGNMLDNVNRWRGQVGLPPVTNESATPPQHLAVGATQADVFDFAGTNSPAQRIRVVLLPSTDGQEMWFFKLQGSSDSVAAQQQAFDQFVQSTRF